MMSIREIVENAGFAILGAGLILLALLAGHIYYSPVVPASGIEILATLGILTTILGIIYIIFGRLGIVEGYQYAGLLAVLGAIFIGGCILYTGFPIIQLGFTAKGLALPEAIAWSLAGFVPIISGLYLYSKSS